MRIATLVAIASTAAIAVVGLATVAVVERSAEAELRRGSEEIIAAGTVPDGLDIDQLVAERGDQIVDPLSELPPLPGGVVVDLPDGETVIVVSGATAFGGVSAPVTGPGQPQFVTAFTATGGLDEAVAALTRAFWIGGPMLVLGLAVAAWLLAGRALQPVATIVERTKRISTSSPQDRVPVPAGHNELSELAETMNEMLDRIETGSDRQRQFISDASHELRTPLTALIGDVEIALTHPTQVPWRDTAERVLVQGERIELLVKNLLEAATQAEEPGLGSSANESVDLFEVAESEIEWLRGSLNPGVGVTLAPRSGHCLVSGEAGSLSSAVRNLLSNASRHARSTIDVAVESDPFDRVRLTVADDGPGVEPGQEEVIFERFSRLDEARAADSGGSGLGLAIVRSVAERHNGKCWLERVPDGGVRFVFLLNAQT